MDRAVGLGGAAFCVVAAVSMTQLPSLATAQTRAVESEIARSVVAANGENAVLIRQILERWQRWVPALGRDPVIWREQTAIALGFASTEALTEIASVVPFDARDAADQLARIETYLAKEMARSAERQGARNTKLGQTTTDQVFNPITPPCRVVDTRVATSPTYAGPIPVNNQRNFFFYANGAAWNWSVQGGPNALANAFCPGTSLTTDGGTLGAAPSAAVATITVVNPTAAGNFIVWGGAGTFPVTSALNWTGAGQVLANTTVIPAGGRGTGLLDFTVRYNGVSGAADVIVDVIGYYTSSTATALQCETVSASGSVAANSDNYVSPPSCPAGYTETGIQCYAGIYLVWMASTSTLCAFHNTTASAASISAYRRCCRVPGH